MMAVITIILIRIWKYS